MNASMPHIGRHPWHHRLALRIENAPELAGGRAGDRCPRPHQVDRRHALLDDQAAFRLRGCPAEEAGGERISQVERDSYTKRYGALWQ